MNKPLDLNTPKAILEAIETILDEALVRHHDPGSDETFIECKICGEWEGHHESCPLPAIEKWQFE